MAYRLHSTRFNTNYWFIAIPKTGSQSIRQVIEENIDPGNLLEGALGLWHTSIKEIQDHPSYSRSKDNFFAIVRNPWAQAWSNFNYQKQRMQLKIDAYNGGASGIEAYRKKYPLNIIEDFSDTGTWKKIFQLMDEYYHSFDDYIDKLRLKIRYPVINTKEDLDKFIESGNSTKEINQFRNHSNLDINGFLQSDMLVYDRRNTNNLITMPIERPATIIHFFNEFFPECNIKTLPYINIGTHANKDYVTFYSKRTRDIIYEVEYSLIKRHNYTFGD